MAESQQSLQGKQKLSTAILNAAKDLLVVVLDREGRIVQFNPVCQEITGYSLEDAKVRLFWDFLPAPEETALVKASFQETLKGIRLHSENHWLTKDGRRRLIAWSNTLANGNGGVVDYVIRTGVDVTKREEAEEHARDSELTMRALLEAAPEAFLAHNAQDRIVFVNAATEEMFGYGREEMVGQPLAMLIPERFRLQHAEHVANFYRNPGRRSMGRGLSLVALRKGGSEFPVDISLSYVETRGGVLAVSFISDITERNKSEETLRSLTSRLIGIQEIGAREVARELHDDLSQKLAALGMEVSTLLAPSAKAPPSLAERVHAVSARIDYLAQDIHAISRRLHPAILDELGLEAALQEECIGFSAQEGYPVQFESKRVPASVPDDVSLCLYRVAQESLRNIAKHAKARSVRVQLLGKNAGIALHIKDSGDGFDLNVVKGRRGLGVVSMEERVRLVNGKPTIQSEPGKGTLVIAFAPLGKKRK
jgi:PAS domain S-box-containing protein